MSLLYTICFCRRGDAVLLLHRRRQPNAGRWTGLGGKIEPGESPLACVRREVWEEARIDLRTDGRLRFAGVVSWEAGVDRTRPSTGMYAYVAEIDDGRPGFADAVATPDGVLAWKPIAWACDCANRAVVANVPYVLPALLAAADPMEHRCRYAGGRLIGVVACPLAAEIARRAAGSLSGEPMASPRRAVAP